MIETQKILDALNGLEFLKSIFSPQELVGPNHSDEVKFCCPFHGESNPSAAYNIYKNLFECFVCGQRGNAIDLLAHSTNQKRNVAAEYLARQLGVSSAKQISAITVEEYHAALKINQSAMSKLMERKGIDLKMIEQFRLGWDMKQKRLTIPVRDHSGFYVNIRLYDLFQLKDPSQKMRSIKGHGEIRLFPINQLDSDEIIITEGELKAVGLIQRGFNAISPTGGAKGWDDAWLQLFKDKVVTIIYDIDNPGLIKSADLAKKLMTFAKRVKVVKLPLELVKHPTGDVLDYFVIENYSAQDLINLINGTEEFDPGKTPKHAGLNSDQEYPVHLASASKAQYYLHKVEVEVVVASKDTAPYIVPRNFQVECTRDNDYCAVCPVYSQHKDCTWVIEPDEPVLLELINTTKLKQSGAIKDQLGIPYKCKSHVFVIQDSYNVEEVMLIPQFEIANEQSSETTNRAYYVGHGIETNETYKINARSVVNPRSQHAVLLIYKATPNVDSLTTFSPTDEELKELKAFQPDEWTVDGIQRKLDEIYLDLSHNVTNIYNRQNLHLLYDLAWHSVLNFEFNNNTVKGWMDVIVIGDSGQGKSDTAIKLLRHYGLGERLDMKGSSVAGLKGGLQSHQDRWFVSWGKIPLNNKRLVILEEAKGTPVEVLQALTDMRSSGIAELTKIEKRRTNAQTRLIWISNPRSDRQVSTYNFGVDTFKELMGSLEDVRRFDLGLVVVSGEVTIETINKRSNELEAVNHVYDSDRCQRLILWAWSRKPTDIIFEEDALEMVKEVSMLHAKKYSSTIPLVEPADHRFKLLRTSAALAARTFSTNGSDRTLIVKKCHVQYIDKYMQSIYDTKAMGYDRYSKIVKENDELHRPDEIRQEILKSPFAKDFVKCMMRNTSISYNDIIDWSGHDKDQSRDTLSLFVRCNALHRRKTQYYKTSQFIEFLKELEEEVNKIDTSKLQYSEDF